MGAKQVQRAEVNTFVNGLITEASPLSFPDNSSADEENFELHKDGKRTRRLGMDLEFNPYYRATGLYAGDPLIGINLFKWNNVSGDVGLEFVVCQFGNTLHFNDTTASSMSSDGYKGSVVLDSFPSDVPFSFASIDGSLVVAAGVSSFANVSYSNGVFSHFMDRIVIRDLFGIEESQSGYEQDPSWRDSTFYPEHTYNLQNQSWGTPKYARFNLGGVAYTSYIDPIYSYFNWHGAYPSNSEQVWLALNYSASYYNPDDGGVKDPIEELIPALFAQRAGADGGAAGRGYFLIDALNRSSSRQEAIRVNYAKYPDLIVWGGGQNNVPAGTHIKDWTVPLDYTTGGASCVAEFAGRVFFSGFNGELVGGDKRSPDYTNYIFFSRLVRNKNDIGKCYQVGDPSGRESPDIVDTDGGFLRVSEAKGIHSLISIGQQLIILASNGVWTLAGGSDYGFTASNYKVTKISNLGCISAYSVVTEGNRIYFFGEDGIYTVGQNEMGDLTVENITITSIQTYYQELPFLTRVSTVGYYDLYNKKVRWMTYEGTPLEEGSFNREIVLDTALGAFSINRICNVASGEMHVVGGFKIAPLDRTITQDSVIVGTEEVFANTEPVYTEIIQFSDNAKATKYLVLRKMGNKIYYSFCYYNNLEFRDWVSVDGEGVDAKAYMVTGTVTAGDSAVKKQIPYLVIHMERTEDSVDSDMVPNKQSSCLFSCQWDFANNVSSKRWTPPMQAYRYRMPHFGTAPNTPYSNGFEVITTKNKVRGSGKAFALRFETEPYKDCKLLGWNLSITGNGVT